MPRGTQTANSRDSDRTIYDSMEECKYLQQQKSFIFIILEHKLAVQIIIIISFITFMLIK